MGLEILYLHPEPRGEAPVGWGASYPVMPVGALGLCNLLVEAGHRVVGLNAPLERVFNPGFRLEDWARTRRFDLVLVELHWAEHALGSVEAARTLRGAWPGAALVAGGLTASRFPEELLALAPGLNAVVVGDAEGPMVALAAALEAGSGWQDVPNLVRRQGRSGAVWRADARAYDALDSVELGWLERPEAYRRLLHSRPPAGPQGAGLRGHWLANGRGCAFECLYCGGSRSAHASLALRKGLLKRDPRRLVEDVARLAQLGVEQVALTLDPDMLGAAHRDAFFAGLDGAVGLYVESFQLPSDALIAGLAARAALEHTEVALTPLSGDAAVRWRNGKHYRDDALLDRLERLWSRNISTFIFFSLNLIGEDERTLDATLALARRLVARAPAQLLRIMNITHTLDPASPMAERPDGVEIGFRTLADWVAFGRQARPWRFLDGERGFRVPGRDLRAMAQRWDTLAAELGPAVLPVPSG